jgi:hypothetical protein
VAIKEQYQVKISNRFAAFDNLKDDNVQINRVWESIRKNMNNSATESPDY